jgi:hypothetical protein
MLHRSFLSAVLQLPSYRFDAREAIQLDYASYILEFAKEQKLGPLQTSSLFEVGQNVLRACREGQQSSDCEALLRKELLQKCKAKVTLDSSDFTADLVAKAGQFFARTFFAHFRLYNYAFTAEQDLSEFSSTLLVETPLIPSSFDSAITSEEWEAKLEQARLDREAAKKAEEEELAAQVEAERKEQEEKAIAEAKAQREEELRKKPETLDEAVAQAVALKLEEEKAKLASEYGSREEALVKQIQDLEAKLGGGAKKK